MDNPRAQAFSLPVLDTDSESSLIAFASDRRPHRVALVGNYPPRKCGIATFSGDLAEQLNRFRTEVCIDVYALDDAGLDLPYQGVTATLERGNAAAYIEAANAINNSGADVVWLQHEFGIFGGADGEMVCDFVDRLAPPLIVTCHTVLSEPAERQRRILDHLVARASRIMVMSNHSRNVLRQVYHAPSEIVEVIEHGAPDRPFGREQEFKARHGLSDRAVLMTFGLLGPSKGLETVIEALPAIRRKHPEALYRIVGATHPKLLADQGDAYREDLKSLAANLGVADMIEWDNRFVETEELLDQLEACDIYITPYPGLQQSTSGTLSYAVALGKAVISTPYVHARELLVDGVGCLVEPGCANAIANCVINLLDNPEEMDALKTRAHAKGRKTIWPRFAASAAALVEHAIATRPKVAASRHLPFHAVAAMSDATGILQHAIGIVPDRLHGYCLDDNARALMLVNVATGIDPTERRARAMTYASFVQHAWNPDGRGFRNFMRFDRSWCEEYGSEDSNGRAVWALGRTAEDCPDTDIREWAKQLYDNTLPELGEVGSPRAVAFMMLGAAAMLRVKPGHDISIRCLESGAATLDRLLGGARRPDWAWFEIMLGYDNPRMPQALIEAGELLGRKELVTTGIETLRWIADRQTAANGHFRPVGSQSFGRPRSQLPFDQQPLEAQAAIEAAVTAHRATADLAWVQHAQTAWQWFFDDNDRGAVLADQDTGRCRDGITPRGANANCGAEPILAFQLAHYSMLALAPFVIDDSGKRLENRLQDGRRPLAYS
jgi:glycosyltransferase involved in cell wall biosynthesis